jgi:DNA-binding IclR family transcriptional regulator
MDGMANWHFLTNHGRALLCIARDPEVRLRDIAAFLDITERRAFGIVTDLTEAGYVVKTKDGRRNRYRILAHLPLPEQTGRDQAIGEVLQLLTATEAIPRTLRTRRGDYSADEAAAET